MNKSYQDIIKKISSDWDDSSSGNGSFWSELVHMERHGFDISVLYSLLHGKLVYDHGNPQFDGPFARDSQFDIEAEKLFLIDVRNRIRESINLPPLTESEIEKWKYVPSQYLTYRFLGDPLEYSKSPGLDDIQIDQICSYLRAHYADVVRYMMSVHEWNRAIGGSNSGPRDKEIIREHWFSWVVEDAICRNIEQSGNLFLMNSMNRIHSNLMAKNLGEGVQK